MLPTLSSRAEGPHFESTVAYWQGLAAKVGKGLSYAVPQTQGAITIFLGSVLSGPVSVYPVRGQRIPKGTKNPFDTDVYYLDLAQRTRTIAMLAPDSYSPVDLMFTVRILNPGGDIDSTLSAIRKILPTRGRAVIVEEGKAAGPQPDTTEVSLSGSIGRDDVDEFIDDFGPHKYVPVTGPGTPHMRYADVDMTIVLGKSFAGLPKVPSAGPP